MTAFDEERRDVLAVLPAGVVGLPEDEWESALNYLKAALAPSTRDSYFRAFRNFCRWCGERELVALPAEAETVATFFAFEADRGISPSTIGVRAAAIAAAHEAADLDPPTQTVLARRIRSGIRRTKGTRKSPKAALVADDLKRAVQKIPVWRYQSPHGRETVPSLRGLRDRAILLLGFALAARRSELVALKVDDIEIVEEGLLVSFAKSKTDQEGEGQMVAVPRGTDLCPVVALESWLNEAAILEGPIFRPISKADRVFCRDLNDRQIARIVKARAEAVGLDADQLAGHSLRSGFLTTAANNRASPWKMMEVSRHKDIKQLRHYVRRTELFESHAGDGML